MNKKLRFSKALAIGVSLIILTGCSNSGLDVHANRAAASTINTVVSNEANVASSDLSASRGKDWMGNTQINIGGSIIVTDDSDEVIKDIATQVVNTSSKVLRVQNGTIDYDVVVGSETTGIQEYMGKPKDQAVSFKSVKEWVESSN